MKGTVARKPPRTTTEVSDIGLSIKIDKDVPIPPPASGLSPWPLEQMEIGDSFFAPSTYNVSTEQLRARISSRAKRVKVKCTIRVLTEHGVTGVRCWRVA